MSATGQAATYQRLRDHLDFLKLPAAAEALPGILDAARAEDRSMVEVLEELLSVEVHTTQARPARARTARAFCTCPAPRRCRSPPTW
jgi:hypothetical protein